jgi:hypothetical protein
MLDALTPEELQFIKAIEKYKKINNKHFLSWTEVLKVINAMGYRKVAKPEAIPITIRGKTQQPVPEEA